MLSRVLHCSCRRSRSMVAVAPRSLTSVQQQQQPTPAAWLISHHNNTATAPTTTTTRRPLSSSSAPQEESTSMAASSSRFAVVDHSEAYEASMRGPHGKQLELAQLEGMGKDNPPFNPFWEDDEMEEEDEGEEEEEEEEGEGEEDGDDDTAADAVRSPYNNDGSLRWKKSQLATFRAGAPAGGMFAVVELAGSQHKVTTDDVLNVNRLKPVENYPVGSVHTLRDVMMVGSSHQTLVGMPYVTGAEVDVMVEEVTQDEKVVVFKKRRRKNYKRKKGHRRNLTLLRILDIRSPQQVGEHHHVPRENPSVDV